MKCPPVDAYQGISHRNLRTKVLTQFADNLTLLNSVSHKQKIDAFEILKMVVTFWGQLSRRKNER